MSGDADLGPLFAGMSPPRRPRPLSDRLARLVRALRAAGAAGLTSRELAAANGSVAPHSDIAELRGKGFEISCERHGASETGRTLYSYRLEREPS